MPTRNTLFFLFLLLVCVPVAAAVYLGAGGLARERAVRVEREREAMQRRADDLRDGLVRELQLLYRVEASRPPEGQAQPQQARQIVESSAPIQDRFRIEAPGQAALVAPGEEPLPADIEEFASGDLVRRLLEDPKPLIPLPRRWSGAQGQVRAAASEIRFRGDLAFRLVRFADGRRLLDGFRVDVPRLAARYLDPLSPHRVVQRFDERIDEVRLERDDPRNLVRSLDGFGLPQRLYRHVVPAGRNAPPVLLPPGYLLVIEIHPVAALARDLEETGTGLLWTLSGVGVVVLLGMVFLWRALRAETRLAMRKSEFVNTVSHELRTPLTSIRMYADMLKEGWVDDPATAQEYVALMSAESERLTRLVNNVLDFARIEKGRKTFHMQVGDPAPVIREVAELLRPYLKAKGFELELAVPERLPACRFDRDALTQILLNLIDNAVKYGAREVRVEADAAGGEIGMRVMDRGPGVDPGERERIFEAFRRGKLADQGGGSGLGLALVRHAVAAHGGRVEVEDREGGGAAFLVALPAA